MNWPNLIKKIISLSLIILYNIVSFFWCYIISSTLIFDLTVIQTNEHSIGIFGGVDAPTAMFIIGKFLGGSFFILFVLLSIATIFLLTVSIFKKQTNRKFNILLCIFPTLTLFVFMLIPLQTYVVSLYALVRKLSFLKYIRFIYIIISLIIIVTNILFAINNKNS